MCLLSERCAVAFLPLPTHPNTTPTTRNILQICTPESKRGYRITCQAAQHKPVGQTKVSVYGFGVSVPACTWTHDLTHVSDRFSSTPEMTIYGVAMQVSGVTGFRHTGLSRFLHSLGGGFFKVCTNVFFVIACKQVVPSCT